MEFKRVPIDYEISFEEIRQKIWEIINPIVTEVKDDGTVEQDREYRYFVENVYDEYCIICLADSSSQHYKLPYSRVDDNISVDMTQIIPVEERYLTDEECAAIDGMRESFVSLQNDVEKFQETIAEKDKEIERLGEINGQMQAASEGQATDGQMTYSLEDYALLQSDIASKEEQINQMQVTIDELVTKHSQKEDELKNLQEYKTEIELKTKTDFINQYAGSVDENVVHTWLDEAANYSMIDIKTKIALYFFENGAPARIEGKTQIVGNTIMEGIDGKTVPGYIKLLEKVKK